MALIGALGVLDAKVVLATDAGYGSARLTVRMADGTQHDIGAGRDIADLWSAAKGAQEIMLALGYNAGLERH